MADGTACDDQQACTTGDACQAGECTGATTATCSQTADGCCPAACTALNDIDCACSMAQLSTPFNDDNDLDGNMFHVVALKNIEV